MKSKLNQLLTAVAVLTMVLFTSCSSNSGTAQFLGEWQSVDSPERPHMTIQERGDNLTLLEGKKEYPLTYDKDNHKLTVNTGFGAMDIIYLDEKNHLLVSGEGEYTQVAK
ncbi:MULTISPECIES: DUF3876 domain-containing protein [Hymenobacter]|uniref:Lipoprotein n=1 Tax=Hymenobacter psychrotolerans DSM 18569 TaxID=1121959 RepID=A0A1M6ZYJ4_9BACT|nr:MULTISPECIES: hypothetical protein [Hymenobacter]QNE42162.1 hypothetical protein F1C16_21330 [Hymenobacter sp. NBH84]SHL35486.1 hypothetical protein SAMN02746009_02608 [Hymenobacter psychrotolerans DSM 18569]